MHGGDARRAAVLHAGHGAPAVAETLRGCVRDGTAEHWPRSKVEDVQAGGGKIQFGLHEGARALLAGTEPVPRPAGWTGYRLVPESTEFLYASPDRLHRRLRYDRDQGQVLVLAAAAAVTNLVAGR
ncbi:pyridoxine 5'-phosphate oxidase C-terminal domain-containing protein [Streptomyces mirabilis]|uniref:pyridoxine 5'-phosphate oxidase C-terminal domain-containing protein n=1 Tax=Streptomyces mirabilis TaxID=68239 RepID=UPI00362BA728